MRQPITTIVLYNLYTGDGSSIADYSAEIQRNQMVAFGRVCEEGKTMVAMPMTVFNDLCHQAGVTLEMRPYSLMTYHHEENVT